MFTIEYLLKEAAECEPLTVNENLGREINRAGLIRPADVSAASANRASPMPSEEAVGTPRVFQVRKGASSSYCPRRS